MAKINILFEDNNVLVIDKPAGLSVYPPNENYNQPTVVSELRHMLKNSKIKIVHRLDKDTSGVMILAKNQESLDFLQAQFKNRKVKKIYQALVWGRPKYRRAKLELPIRRSTSAPNKMTVNHLGRYALSEYECKKYNSSFSFLEITIYTGRTHQIRVQFSYIGHPIVGDKLYSNRPIPKQLNRQFLHAHKLKLKLPSGKDRIFTSELTMDLQNFLKSQRWKIC